MRFSILATFTTSLAAVGLANAAPSFKPVPASVLQSSNGTAVVSEHKGPSADLVLPDYDALIYCTGLTCTGDCYYVDVDDGIEEEVCYGADVYYYSIMAYTPDDATWDFLIYAGYDDCDSGAQISTLNTCYNLEYDDTYAQYNSFFFEP